MDRSRKTRELFRYGMSAVYLFAFGSWFVQIPGLYGDNGLIPVRNTLERMKPSGSSVFERPNAMWPLMSYGFSPQTALDLVCLSGVIVSFLSLAFGSMRSMPVYLILWFLYLSLFQVGGTFSSFQWDILLLEAGFLTCLVSPVTPMGWKSPMSRLPFFLVKWLLFRLMFASGVVKLTSRCPTWWGLTALSHHFESQCIPSAMAWWVHQLPQWCLKLGVVGTYVIEIALPFLFFSPIRKLRLIAVYGQVFLMACIMATGNYNFFNILTIVLCLSALDDDHVSIYGFECEGKKKPQDFGTKNFRKLKKIIAAIVTVVMMAGFLYYTVKYFGLQFFNAGQFLDSKITFDFDQFQSWVDEWTVTGMWIGALFFIYESLYTLYLCVRKGSLPQKLVRFVKYLCLFGICTYMFAISMVPLKSVTSNRRCWPIIHEWHASTANFELVHSYGLFRSMTGVGGRPEVIVLGADSMSGPWKEVEFLYKPGNVSQNLPWIVPHQPRLDWQLWFAALGQYQHNPWFVSLVDKLLSGDKEVVRLLDAEIYPFKNSPPKYVKAELHLYHFTLITKGGNVPKRTWTRRYNRDYLPAVSLDHQDLKTFLKHHGLEGKRRQAKSSTSQVELIIRMIRAYVQLLPADLFLWSLWLTALAISLTRSMASKALRK